MTKSMIHCNSVDGSNLTTTFVGTECDLSNKVLENNQMGSIEYDFLMCPFWMVRKKVEIGFA